VRGHASRDLVGDARATAEQKHAPAQLPRAPKQRQHQVRPRNFFGQRRAHEPRSPEQGLSITEREARAPIGLEKLGVALDPDHMVNIWREHAATLAASDERRDAIERTGARDGIDPDLANSNARRLTRAPDWFCSVR